MTPKTTIAYIAILFVMAAVAFHRFAGYNFFDGWDDREHYADAAAIAADVSHMWNPERQQPFRPPVDAYWVAGYALGGGMSTFHILRIGLHVCVALMICLVMQRMMVRDPVAMAAGALFLVNVGHFRAVHWATTTTYVLCALFALVAVYLCSFGGASKKKMWAGIAVSPLAVLSHPAGIFIVPVLWYYLWAHRRTNGAGWAHFTSVAALCGMAFAACVLVTPGADQGSGGFSGFDPVRVVNPFWYAGTMALMTAWPVKALTTNAPNLWAIGVGVAMAGLSAFAIWARPMSWHRAFFIMWGWCAFLPFLNHPFERLGFGPSRQTYLSSVAWCALVAIALWWVCQGRRGWYYATAGAICAVSVVGLWRAEALTLYLAGRGYQYQKNEAASVVLYRQAIATSRGILPEDIYSRLALAGAASGDNVLGDLWEAWVATENPEIPGFVGLLVWGKSEYAERMVMQSIEAVGEDYHRANMSSMAYNCGLRCKLDGDIGKAAEYFRLALRLNPGHPRAGAQLREVAGCDR